MSDKVGQFGTTAQAVKVASVLVHVQEAMSKKGHNFDVYAMKGLMDDAEVKAWLASFPDVLLPRKRP